VDDHDFQIVETYGKTVPDIRKKKGDYENLFPKFTTWREQIDGQYWFPTYTRAEDTLKFAGGDVKIREIIKYTNYRRFWIKIEDHLRRPGSAEGDGAEEARRAETAGARKAAVGLGFGVFRVSRFQNSSAMTQPAMPSMRKRGGCADESIDWQHGASTLVANNKGDHCSCRGHAPIKLRLDVRPSVYFFQNPTKWHADGSITFRYKDPAAGKVLLNLEGAGKPLPMQKDSDGVGAWSHLRSRRRFTDMDLRSMGDRKSIRRIQSSSRT